MMVRLYVNGADTQRRPPINYNYYYCILYDDFKEILVGKEKKPSFGEKSPLININILFTMLDRQRDIITLQ